MKLSTTHSAAPVPVVVRLAHLVSDVCAPQYLVTLVLLTAPLRDHAATLTHAVVAASFVTGIPMLVLAWMRRSGRVEDRHVSVRERRTPLFLAALGSLLTGLVLLVVLDAPGRLMHEVLAVLAGLLSCLVVNLRWKISVHAAVGVVAGLVMLPMHVAFALAAVIGWSRIRTNGHTASQVLGGTLLGLAVHLGLDTSL